MTTIAQLAREHGVDVALEGYHAPADDGKTITAPDDHPLWEKDPQQAEEKGLYECGDLVEPFDMVNAHLRIAEEYTTPGGYVSAEAKRARTELARRAANRPVKKARKNAIVGLLVDAGVLDADD